MKGLKRIVAVVLSVVMLAMAVPMSEIGVQAAENGVQEKIDDLRSVYYTGTYFTKSGNPADSSDWGYPESTTADSQLANIPARGNLPAGSVLGLKATSCYAFSHYCFYYIFGHRPDSNVTQVSMPSLGDYINLGDAHFAIYLGQDSSNYYVYDCNWDCYCGVRYYGAIPKTWSSNVTFYHSNNYDSVYGTTQPSVTYSTITTGKYYIKNTSTGTYLNVDGGTDAKAQNVSVASFTGGTSMQMEISSATSGYKIRPLCSSSRLINPYADYVSSGVNVNIYDNVNDSSQWWGFEKVSGGYVIRNMQNQNCVLSLSGTNVIVSTYTGATNQIWTLEPYETYTVTYNANGGSGAPASQTKVHGVALTLSSTKPTRSGYTFKGWATSSSGVPATYSAGGTYTANASVTLYAVWQANTYNVIYYPNGGTDAPSTQIKVGGEDLTLSSIVPVRSGYTFLGWGTSSTATSTAYQPGDIYTKNADIILYAIWQKNSYTTYFDANGGNGSIYTVREADEPITFPNTEPTKAYHKFLGWADTATSTTAKYFPGDEANARNHDVTFYAVWEAPTVMEDGVEYTVEFGEEEVEEYFAFTPEQSGYYKISEDDLYGCGDILWCDGNGGESTNFQSLKYLESGETCYLKCQSSHYLDEQGEIYTRQGNLILSTTYLPITHMEVTATRTVFPSDNKQYSLSDFNPTFTIYAGDSIYFEGSAYEVDSQCGDSVESNASKITTWSVGTQVIDINIGDLTGQMEVIVKESSIVSIEPIGENVLIENYHGYETTDSSTGEIYFRYSFYYDGTPFEFIATYDNGYSETLGISSLTITDTQSSSNAWGIGVHTVVGEYQGVSSEFKVEVIEHPVETLEIVSEPIVIKGDEYLTCGSTGVFSYDLENIINDHPIKVQVTYKDGTEEIIELNSTEYSYLYTKECTVKTSGTLAVGETTIVNVQYMGSSSVAETSIQIIEGNEIDLIVSGKVVEFPERSGTYPIGCYYDVTGIKVELTYKSGETEIVTLDSYTLGNGCVALKQYDCYLSYDGIALGEGEEKNIEVSMGGITIPIETVKGTVSIVDKELLTVPTNFYAVGADMRCYFSDDTTQDVRLLKYEGSHGLTGKAEYGWIQTNDGYWLDWSYSIKTLEGQHLSLRYSGIGAVEFEEINAKILARVVQQYFKNGVSFNGEQDDENVNAMVLTALAYYMFEDGMIAGISIEEAQTYIKATFNVDDLDLTKSIYYDPDSGTLQGDVYFDEYIGFRPIFTDQFELHHDNGENWVYKCTDSEENIIYVEMTKSTNQILYIGATYEIVTLDSISIASRPQKTSYYIGDAFDASGLQLQLNYSDGTTEVITEGYTLSEFDAYQTGEQMIIVTYEDLSTMFTVTVEAPSITISSDEETIELEETVALTVETNPVEQSITWTSSEESVATVVDGVVTAVAPGTTVITAQFTYNDIVYSQTCTVIVNEPTAVLTSIVVATNPTKTEYIVGEELDTTEMALRLNYDDGTSEIVSEGFEVSGFDSATTGVQTLSVSYEGITTSLSVTVANPSLTLSDSERTLVIGGTVQLNAATTPNGQAVTWTSSDTNVATVSDSLVTATYTGTTVITAQFEYNGEVYEQSCTITVVATLTSIEIATSPTKTTYNVGESLDTTGLAIQLNYDDGTTKVSSEGFTTYGFNSETAGTQTINVYYQGHVATYSIVVNEVVNENDPQIVVESKKNVAGKTVTVDIVIKNNPGIASAMLTLDFDTSALTLVDVVDAGNLGIQCHKPELTSPYTLAWMNDTATEDFTFNGTIVTLTFEIAEDAEVGDYTIDLSYDYDNYDIWNVNVEKVKFAAVDGVITVIDTIIGDINGDGAVNTLDRMNLARYLANWEGYTAETIDLVAADVNGDGVINTLDRMALARHLANWSGYETLPCEI